MGGDQTPVLTLTLNPTIDITWRIDRLEPNGKNRANLRGAVGGGGGINVARCITRLGGQATALHTAGQDVGRRLNRLLGEEGLHHLAVDLAGETREAIVLLEGESERSFHIVPEGPAMSEEEGESCLQALSEAAVRHPYVVVSGSLPTGLADDFYVRVIACCEAAGSRVILDTSGRALRHALEAGVFLMKPNKREAATVIGRRVEAFEDAREANEVLLERGAAQIVVTTIGELGALCSTTQGHHEVHTPPLPREAVSDAGAGDSLVGAMTYRLTQGDDPVEACAWGVAAAAASVLTPGTELFRRSEVDPLLPGVMIR